MNVLVTGSLGFIGKNLIYYLRTYFETVFVYEYDINNTNNELEHFVLNSDYIFHLAGINRTNNKRDFYTGNVDLTKRICNIIESTGRNIPIIISSSIQVNNDNDYGQSKKLAENYLIEYKNRTGNTVKIYRLTNVFGKWCKPNYNSVVATFCYNIANDYPIKIHNENTVLTLVYIDDLVKELVKTFLHTDMTNEIYLDIPKKHSITLGGLAKLLFSFRESRKNKLVPFIKTELEKKLYSTYTSYLSSNNFVYDLKMNIDERGSFTEFLKSSLIGQISVNISKPGIIKGNHWHNTKVEKFLVVSGKGVIRFRNILEDEIIEYYVSGEKLQVIDIPIGYTHNIENIGEDDLVTIMWANEKYDESNPDTIFEVV